MNHNIKSGMKSEGEIIFDSLLDALNQDADAVVALFHPDTQVIFPYAKSLGTTEKMNFGEWYSYLRGGLPNMPNIKFDQPKVFKVDTHTYWAEIYGETTVPTTGKVYKQNWVMFFTLEDGKIKFYKEYWDPYAVLQAFSDNSEDAVRAIFNTGNE